VFIYGTSKRGFPLHGKGLKGARYLGEVETVAPYPLYIAGSFYGPMMLDRPGEGLKVRGELFGSVMIVFPFSTSLRTSARREASARRSTSCLSVGEFR
jgi:gamma-glutamylcyclotransferase (GGCT)/AIG2-like uncharacterized protein YtfP